MGQIFRFLQALTRLASKGDIKIDDAYKFAKQEFGEVSDLLKLQINKIFKQSKAPSIKNASKDADIVPFNKNQASGIETLKTVLDAKGFNDLRRSFRLRVGKNNPDFNKELSDKIANKEVYTELSNEQRQILLDDVGQTFNKSTMSEAADQSSPLMKKMEDVKENIKGMSENNPKTFRMPEEERAALGYPNRMIEGIIRTAAREILSKKGIDVSKADPIDTFADIFGVNSLERLEDVSDELLSAQDYKQLNSILQKNELYNVTPKSGLNLKQSDEIEELTEFDPTDRKPNAMGGINRIGYGIGSLPKGIQALVKTINKKFGKGAVKTADEMDQPPKTDQTIISEFEARNPNPKRQLTDEEIRDYEVELGDSEAWMNNGTVGEAESALKNKKSYEDSMLKEYKTEGGSKRAGGPNDPMAEAIDNASPGYSGDLKYDANVLADDLAEKRFGKEFYDLSQTQQMDLYDEAYQALAENRRVMKKIKKDDIDISQGMIDLDELNFTSNAKAAKEAIDNASINDEIKRGVADVMSDTSPAGLAKSIEIDNLMLEYPGINRDLAKQIANDPDPKRKADVISMIEQTFKMDEMGMSGDEIIDAFKKGTDRTKQANGGLSYLMGM